VNVANIVACPNPPFHSPDFTSSMSSPGSIGVGTARGTWRLSCHHCNLHKGPNLSGVDPQDGRIGRLFNPREDRWEEHFETRGLLLLGLTSTGRITVSVLAMNSQAQLETRRAAGLGP